MEYAFHFYNGLAETGVFSALSRFVGETPAPPVVLCIGSDLAIGDCLGPVTGSLLKKRADFKGYVYGTLKSPVTAKEVKYLNDFVHKTHPESRVIAVDAAVGEECDVGLVKVSDTPLRPGSGANKRLGKVGDFSILGVVARKSAFTYSFLNLTRFHMVYAMAELISSAIASASCCSKGVTNRANLSVKSHSA